MATTHTTAGRVALPARLGAGVAGGLAGGVVFGALMQAWGMLPMVAMLVGSDSTTAGWLVHLANSAIFGALFALLPARLTGALPAALGTGLAYGLAWWVLGALLIMPAWLGMSEMIFHLNAGAWRSLAGHLLFGLLLGAVYAMTRTRTTPAHTHR